MWLYNHVYVHTKIRKIALEYQVSTKTAFKFVVHVSTKFICSGDGKKVMIDVESKTGPEILEIVSKVAGATEM